MAETMLFPINHQGNEINIAATMEGDSSELLVFLHGLGCTKESFDGAFDVPDLRDNYRILTVDLPGFGESDKPDSFSYELEEQADIVTAVVRAIEHENTTIVGHSMSGVVGLLAARKLEAGLFINCEGNFVSEDAGMASRRNASQPEDEFLKTGFESFVTSIEDSPDSALRTWAEWCRQASPLAFYRSARSLVKWSDSGRVLDMYQALRNTAYIHGDHGEISPATESLRSDEVFSIPNSGHFMMVDNPEAFYGAIADVCLNKRSD